MVNTTDTWDSISRDPLVAQDVQTRYGTNFTGPLANGVAQNAGFLRIPDDSSIWKSIPDPTAGPNSPHIEFLFSDGFVGVVDSVPDTKNFLTVATMTTQPTSGE